MDRKSKQSTIKKKKTTRANKKSSAGFQECKTNIKSTLFSIQTTNSGKNKINFIYNTIKKNKTFSSKVKKRSVN